MTSNRNNVRAAESELALQRCSFCHDQCMSATPEAVFSGDQSHVVSRVASMIRRSHSGDAKWNREAVKLAFGGLSTGRQGEYCIYQDGSQRIEPYLYDFRFQAVERGVAPVAVLSYAKGVDQTGSELALDLARVRPPNSSNGLPSANGVVLVGGDASWSLDPGGWSASLEILGKQVSVLSVGSSGYVEFTLGLRDLARRAAEQASSAIRRFGDAATVITTDPALAIASRYFWPVLGVKPEKILTVVEYLESNPQLLDKYELGFDGPNKNSPKVVYHDPGTLGRVLGITEEPRKLLSMTGAPILEPFTSGRLAGDDGGYPGYPYPEIARRTSLARVEELESTGAALIVTASPWSASNLREFSTVPVVDVTTFLISVGEHSHLGAIKYD